MPYINESTRLMFFRDYDVAYDAHLNIVSRRRQDGYIENCYGDWPLMLKMKTMDDVDMWLPLPRHSGMNIQRLGSLWRLDYPVAHRLLGLYCNETFNSLGSSVCVSQGSPLGRAFVKLQGCIRFRIKARQFLRRMLSQVTQSLDEASIDVISSFLMVVSIYPRVV